MANIPNAATTNPVQDDTLFTAPLVDDGVCVDDAVCTGDAVTLIFSTNDVASGA